MLVYFDALCHEEGAIFALNTLAISWLILSPAPRDRTVPEN
jgi:hypothetical protein